MAYNGDKRWEAHVSDLEPGVNGVLTAVREGKALYEEWQSFRNGRDNATIASDFSDIGRPTSEADVAEMDATYSAFDSMQRYLDNDTPPAGIDHGFAFRVFS